MVYIDLGSGFSLRLLSYSDVPSLFQLVEKNRDYLRKWLPWLDVNREKAHTKEFVASQLRGFAEKALATYGIWEGEQLIGVCGFHQIHWANRAVGIGYWLSEERQGKGAVTRAVQGLCRIAFHDLKLNRVEIRVATGNVKSRKIPERLGFHHEGTLRQSEWLYDHFVDHEVYSKLHGEGEDGAGL